MLIACLILACILTFLAAINFPASTPVSLGWLGLFFYFLGMVISRGVLS